jgi:hypothetical protein
MWGGMVKDKNTNQGKITCIECESDVAMTPEDVNHIQDFVADLLIKSHLSEQHIIERR